MKHIEWCPECDEEVEYETDEFATVAVRCPTDTCSHFHIHCDACVFLGVPWARGGLVNCDTDCPWQEEACPNSGEMVPVFKAFGKNYNFTCPSCGEDHTVAEMEGSWDE